jgi:lipoprotein-releasing system ATP-binding protein
MNQSVVLKAKNIHKSFYNPSKTHILRGIDLEVLKGESLAIMGRSGQGKSTLLHILGTLENPCEGSIEIANQPLTSFNKSMIRNKHIAFIFQSFHLLDDYTALENVLMPATIARQNTAKGSAAYVRGMHLLESVGLVDRAHYHSKLLSGGEKQRVAIARALCNDPDLIFADEPSGNLDKVTSRMIHDILLGFSKQHGKSIVFVTHDQELAHLCDRAYILRDGALHLNSNKILD